MTTVASKIKGPKSHIPKGALNRRVGVHVASQKWYLSAKKKKEVKKEVTLIKRTDRERERRKNW